MGPGDLNSGPHTCAALSHLHSLHWFVVVCLLVCLDVLSLSVLKLGCLDSGVPKDPPPDASPEGECKHKPPHTVYSTWALGIALRFSR